jgi:16S rRNA (guanine527-N7)-methyltransferase
MKRLEIFKNLLLDYNKKFNLISKSTEKSVWFRHILDSTQLMNFISTNSDKKLVDLGTGAGFPGLIIALLNKNPNFHVKLYEKSKVKRDFLNIVKKLLSINFEINNNVYDKSINADIVVSRAFKKLSEIIKISREIVKKPHKLIVLKGQNAQEEINKAFKNEKYPYKLESSITNNESKIVIINFN